MDRPSAYVLDSFALLAYFDGEPGGPRVVELLDRARGDQHRIYVSLINVGETLYIIERERGLADAQRALAAVDQLPMEVLPVSRVTVLAAAHIKAHYAIAYADAFAVVAAQDQHAVLVTGDPEFESVVKDDLVIVEWLPRRRPA